MDTEPEDQLKNPEFKEHYLTIQTQGLSGRLHDDKIAMYKKYADYHKDDNNTNAIMGSYTELKK